MSYSTRAGGFGAKRDVIAEINITPLTDIFLVLLIIMMVVAPMLDFTGLKMTVPTIGPAPEVTEDPSLIHVKISADNVVSVDETVVPLADLRGLLSRKNQEIQTGGDAAAGKDGLVIEANPESSHDTLAQVMDAVQSAGIEKVAATLADENGDVPPAEEAN